MKPTERFSDRVENYVRYRPGYPAEILQLMRAEMNFDENSVVADIGSGTGIFARLLLESGCTVYGVEPNEPMRRAGEKFLKNYPKFKSLEGTAENTGLPAESVTHVTAAQAFHWFEADKTLAEFERILKPGGFVALIWNNRRLAVTPFMREYEQFMLDYGTDYKDVRYKNDRELYFNDFIKNNFAERIFANEQTLDFEGLKGRWLSASYAPKPEDARFEEMLAELERLFALHASDGKVKILYDTYVFYKRF